MNQERKRAIMKLTLKATIPTPLGSDANVDLTIDCSPAEAIELNRQLKNAFMEILDASIEFKKNDMKRSIEKLRDENKHLSEKLYNMRQYKE